MHIPQDTKVSVMPRFITFTGVDEDTDPRAMRELAAQYPIEWGILFSPKRQGSGRYPSLEFIHGLVWYHRMNYSAHLCGDHSRSVIARGFSEVDQIIADHFRRAQINTSDPSVSPSDIERWGARVNVKPILQCRGPFPLDPSVAWLYDASGGRGIEPETWPAEPEKYSGLMVGYAGGLCPENVAKHLERITLYASDYWIDMESGVRDDRDRFDLAKCRAVCEAVYGTP